MNWILHEVEVLKYFLLYSHVFISIAALNKFDFTKNFFVTKCPRNGVKLKMNPSHEVIQNVQLFMGKRYWLHVHRHTIENMEYLFTHLFCTTLKRDEINLHILLCKETPYDSIKYFRPIFRHYAAKMSVKFNSLLLSKLIKAREKYNKYFNPSACTVNAVKSIPINFQILEPFPDHTMHICCSS